MNYRVELHPKAVLELEDAYEWYEARKEGLGRKFIDMIHNSVNSVVQYPELYPKKKGNYRELSVALFPYVIVYEILKKEQLILISYIFHTKRNPRLKYKR